MTISAQVRRMCVIVAIIASLFALVSGVVLFFVIEPPFLASIFLACGAIAIICFVIAGLIGYYRP
jgi:capsular polysaccharide biosynthesis protein